MPPDLIKFTIKDFQYKGNVTQRSDSKGLPILAVLVGVSLLPHLVDAILRLRTRLVQPGIVIDTRFSKVKIELSATIPKGAILLIDKNGSRLLDSSELKDGAELTKFLASAQGK